MNITVRMHGDIFGTISIDRDMLAHRTIQSGPDEDAEAFAAELERIAGEIRRMFPRPTPTVTAPHGQLYKMSDPYCPEAS